MLRHKCHEPIFNRLQLLVYRQRKPIKFVLNCPMHTLNFKQPYWARQQTPIDECTLFVADFYFFRSYTYIKNLVKVYYKTFKTYAFMFLQIFCYNKFGAADKYLKKSQIAVYYMKH